MISLIRKFRELFNPPKTADEGKLPSEPSLGQEREDLLNERLAQAGVDAEYIHDVDPELFHALRSACKQCSDPDKCMRDLAAGNWEAGQANYCPNADKIDQLIVGKPNQS